MKRILLCVFIFSWLVLLSPSLAAQTNGPGTGIYFTTAPLILRSEPSRSGQNLKVIQKYDPVVLLSSTDHEETIEGKKGTWVNVRTIFDRPHPVEGFVFNGFLTKARVVAQPREIKIPTGLENCFGEGYNQCISQAYPDILSISEDQLTLHLRNGKTSGFPINISDDPAKFRNPAIEKIYSDIGYVSVVERFYECVGYSIVKLLDGSIMHPVNTPVLSPDKKRFLSAGPIDYACPHPGVQIINIAGNAPVIEYDNSKRPVDWHQVAEWKDSQTIRVFRYVQSGSGFAEQEVQLRLINGKWVLE